MEEKREEALSRMKTFGLYNLAVRQFKNTGNVWESQNDTTHIIKDKSKLNRIKKLEEKYNILIYHVITDDCLLDSSETYLYVSDDKDSWEDEMHRVVINRPFVYFYDNDKRRGLGFGEIGTALSTHGSLLRSF